MLRKENWRNFEKWEYSFSVVSYPAYFVKSDFIGLNSAVLDSLLAINGDFSDVMQK